MQVLEVGNEVFLLRFLADNRGLVAATTDSNGNVTFAVLSLPGGERVRLKVPGAKIDSWWYEAGYGNAIAAHPGGESCYIAWGDRLYAFRTADGKPLPVPKGVKASQVILSADGDRLVAGHQTTSASQVRAIRRGPRGGRVLWRQTSPEPWKQGVFLPEQWELGGFLPDGARFVTIENVVRIRSFDTGEEVAAGRYRTVGSQQPQVSPDGRHLAAIGYGKMYFWDLTTLDKPRRIGGTQSFGDFRSFAFHPDGKTVAVIHGGPTLVKVYDLATLQRIHTWKWKLGPLQSVAFSPDGTLGAAGSVDGRIVVWDVDE